VDRLDEQLVLGQFGHERHDPRRARIVRTAGLLFVPVGEGGLVAVMAVGDDQRRCADPLPDAVDEVALDREQAVLDAVLVNAGGGGGAARQCRFEQLRQPARRREHPDGVEVGPHRSEEVEAVALGLSHRALVGQDVFAER
jgi:hypothetical protein